MARLNVEGWGWPVGDQQPQRLGAVDEQRGAPCTLSDAIGHARRALRSRSTIPPRPPPLGSRTSVMKIDSAGVEQ